MLHLQGMVFATRRSTLARVRWTGLCDLTAAHARQRCRPMARTRYWNWPSTRRSTSRSQWYACDTLCFLLGSVAHVVVGK